MSDILEGNERNLPGDAQYARVSYMKSGPTATVFFLLFRLENAPFGANNGYGEEKCAKAILKTKRLGGHLLRFRPNRSNNLTERYIL